MSAIAGSLVAAATSASGQVQQPAVPPAVSPAPERAARPPQPTFGFAEVEQRARELLTAPFDARTAVLPDPLERLDFDTWRDIRFRADRALLASANGPFRMQMFHPGFLYKRTVTVNVIRDGIPTPVPYAANLFDYGRTKFDKPLPASLGFAGFRLHYALNDPRIMDELISFLGASYFRFLGRGQRYGLSARGLAIGVGAKETEEFPFFREFWLELPGAGAETITVHALMDGESVTGAYQFIIYPGIDTVVEVTATIFTRRAVSRIGIAPLTSMFLRGERERRVVDDFRPELHDSDGLLIHTGTGEWLWRPLRNPQGLENSVFLDTNIRGFGLMQRDRTFEHYQDLDLNYELRPSYWVEPRDKWGEGRVELAEIPTGDETNDNIVAYWVPKNAVEANETLKFRYGIRSLLDSTKLNPGGYVLNTYQTRARAFGSAEPVAPGVTRFIVDFTGGDLAHYLPLPDTVQVVPSTSNGTISGAFLVPSPKIKGFRAAIDVQVPPGQSADLRAFLRTGHRALTETWTLPWKAE